jgi:hypothetical protein
LKKFFLILFCCLSFLLKQNYTKGQAIFRGKESQVKETANKYFSKEDYISAQPLYSQLLSLHQQNAEYCYKFGVCLLYTNTKDLSLSIKYLEYALKQSKMPNKIYYYLGRAYHLDYRFTDAMFYYSQYILFLKDNTEEKNDIEHQIEMCKNGLKLLSSISDLYVTQKKEIRENGFFRNYNMQMSNENELVQSREFGGKYLPKPPEFKTKLDKKLEDDNAIIFITDSNEIYFSSYGKNGNNKKDIYKVVKSKDGGWSQPENLGDIINTKYDEDYPFILPDRKTLYFCSKGHNSMGGYDIFKSVFNKATETWSEPENLDFAINTPYDDILFVTDSSQTNAFFSSNRKNTPKMITFYNVKIDKRPVIAKDIKLTVSSNDIMDTNFQKSLTLIKAKAELNVNTGDEAFKPLFNPDSAEASTNKENTDTTQTTVNTNEEENDEDTTSVNTNISNSDIIGIAYEEANKTQNEVKELEIQLNTTLNLANKKNQQSNNLIKEYKKNIETANALSDSTQKETELSKIKNLKYESETLKKEASVAYTITKQLEKKIAEKKKDAADALNYAKTIEKAANTKTKEESIALLDSLTKRIEENEKNKEEPINKDELSPNQQDYLQKKNEAEKYFEDANKLKEEANLIKEQGDLVKKDIEKSRKSSVKEALKNQLANIDEEYKNKMDEANLNYDKEKKTQLQADSIYKDLTVINNLITEIKDNTDSIIQKANKDIAQSNNQSTKAKISANKNLKKTTTNKKTTGKEIAINKTNQNKTETKTTSTTTTANNETILNKQKYDSIITSSINISNTIKNKAEEYKKTADAYFATSNQKNEEARDAMQKANEISEQIKRTSDKTEQNKLLFKADSLLELSQKKNSEASINYDIGKVISDKQKEIQKDADNATNYVNEIKKEANYNYKVVKISNKQKEILNNNKKYTEPKIGINQIITEIYENKEKERANADRKITKLEKENSAISDSIRIINNEVHNQKTQTARKETLKKRIRLLETKSENNKNKIAASKVLVNKLNNDTKNLKDEQFVNTIENENRTQNLPEATIINKNLIEKNLSDNSNKINELSLAINDIKNNSEKQNNPEVENNKVEIKKLDNFEADLKKIELNAKANEEKYIKNKDTLNKVKIENKNDKNILLAIKYEREADSMANIALAFKAKADIETIAINKKDLLINSTDFSNIAINKQKQAIEIYIKAKTEIFLSNETTINNEKKPETQNAQNKTSDTAKIQEEKQKVDSIAFNDNQFTKIEIYNLKSEANVIRENAKSITDKKQKNEELNKADEIEKNAKIKESELQKKINYTKNDIASDNKLVLDKIAIKNDSITDIAVANYLKNNSEKLLEKAKEKTDEANNAENDTEKNKILKEANALTDEAIQKQEKAMDLFEKHPTETLTQKQTVKITGTTAKTKTEATLNDKTKITETTALPVVKVDKSPVITVVTTIDNKIYDGLIFKVQLSAVTKEAPSEAFKGLNPISKGKTDNELFLYYFGVFNNYNEANNAKNDVRTIGFDDAFVVAFLNGKKIPLKEALSLLETNKTKITLPNSFYNIDETLLANRKLEKTSEMPTVDGLYYSVQVGVFARTITPSKLFNIEPLYYEKTPSGNYRYTTGVYNKLNDAINAKHTIVNRGVNDAFVVAFYKGKKITVTEARDLLKRKTAMLVKNNIPSNINTNIATINTQNEKPTIPANKGLFYSIQVGVYAKKITSEKLFNIEPLYFDITARGYYRYITETFTNLKDAINAKNRIVAKGVSDAFVVPFNKGKQITINEARNIERR